MATILRQLIDRFLDDHLNDGYLINTRFVTRDGGVVELVIEATPVAADEQPTPESESESETTTGFVSGLKLVRDDAV